MDGLAFYARMMQEYATLSAARSAALHAWDQTRVDGVTATSDWPGWSWNQRTEGTESCE